jgi:hypothetical protein
LPFGCFLSQNAPICSIFSGGFGLGPGPSVGLGCKGVRLLSFALSFYFLLSHWISCWCHMQNMNRGAEFCGFLVEIKNFKNYKKSC